MITASRWTSLACAAVLVLACEPGMSAEPRAVRHAAATPSAMAFPNSEWSVPVALDAPVNLPGSNEQGPALSPDGLALFFCSNRTGSGGNDLWVSRRPSEESAWGEPVNLGPAVNSAAGDCGPALSQNGLALFFTSARAGGSGGNDIYMTTRTDASDDLGWTAATRLGPEVNTSASEFSPFVSRLHDGECDESGCQPAWADLYFERGPTNVTTDIYRVRLDAGGNVLGEAVVVTELTSDAADGRAVVRFDGRELLMSSNRDGRAGNHDLFVSTRTNPNMPWSTPLPLDALNAAGTHEIHPYLSRDGRTVFFVRGAGTANDIWMATRTPGGR